MSSAEFLSIVHRWMYARRASLVPFLNARSSSSEAGRLYVDLKFFYEGSSELAPGADRSARKILQQVLSGALEHELHVLHCGDVGSSLELDCCEVVVEPCLRLLES